MSNIYFLSDAHLGFKETPAELEKRGKLAAFLEFIRMDKDAEVLYLVGDIFDFWFEWRHVVPRYWFPVLFQLKRLIESGIAVNFITGNHDFYTGRFLEREVGIQCFDESRTFEIEGRRFFVAHGDGLAKEDRGYRLLKRVIRNRVSIFLFKTFLSADLGMQIAKWTSHSSRQLVKIEKHAWAEEYYRFAQEKFRQGFHYVVMGHIHYPMVREDEENGNTYLNTGDWMTRFSYGKFDGNRLTLHYWESH
jgi:UDP-2,3-diacylglucosamine hydrolase